MPGEASGRVRRACARADGLAESPQETRLRLPVVDGGLPAPVAQYVVRHEGSFVARVDLAWPVLRVAVEYDGAWHAEPGQFARDRRRLNALQAAGWTVVFVTAADTCGTPSGCSRRSGRRCGGEQDVHPTRSRRGRARSVCTQRGHGCHSQPLRLKPR
ncbi:endonuclease domain-containing protein [Geodermatophilus sp. SYSU D00525]